MIIREPEQRSRELFRQGGYRRRENRSTLLLEQERVAFFNAVDGGSHQSGTVAEVIGGRSDGHAGFGVNGPVGQSLEVLAATTARAASARSVRLSGMAKV